MNKKIQIIGLIAILVASLFLTACSSNEEITTDDSIKKVVVQKETTVVIDNNNIDIKIIDGKLDPNEINVPLNGKTDLVFHNMQDVEARIDIPMTGNHETATIAAGNQEIITIQPNTPGIYAIELNGARIGTIYVK